MIFSTGHPSASEGSRGVRPTGPDGAFKPFDRLRALLRHLRFAPSTQRPTRAQCFEACGARLCRVGRPEGRTPACKARGLSWSSAFRPSFRKRPCPQSLVETHRNTKGENPAFNSATRSDGLPGRRGNKRVESGHAELDALKGALQRVRLVGLVGVRPSGRLSGNALVPNLWWRPTGTPKVRIPLSTQPRVAMACPGVEATSVWSPAMQSWTP